MKTCKKCGKPITKRTVCESCRKKHNRELKRDFIFNITGNKCWLCGYNKKQFTKFLLSFHHMENKEFTIALSNSLRRRNFSKIIKEIKKCILVCHNCHAEIHNTNLINQNKILKIYKQKWKQIIKRFPELESF
jgi:hypothetical protein